MVAPCNHPSLSRWKVPDMRSIIFDLDGKLVDSAPDLHAAGGDSMLVRKPDPAPLRQAVADLGAFPALYVSDRGSMPKLQWPQASRCS